MNISNPIDFRYEPTTDVHHLLSLADKAYERGELSAAREWLHQAHSLAPAIFSIVSAMGALDYQLGRYELAGRELSQAACLNPEHHGVHSQLAAVWLRLKNMPKFFEALKSAFRLNPDDRDALHLLARGHMAQDLYYEAARVCHRLLALDGRDREALMCLGKCFFELKELDMARLTYERVLQLAPADKVARHNLALICSQAIGRSDEQDDNSDNDIVVLTA